jgi:hypothetical protein
MAPPQRVVHGEALEVLRTLPGNCADAIVTDPPYELGFMGKKWDATGIAYSVELWREVLRVLKPGGHLLAFGGTRTYHRMTCAIEDAGFEIRDCVAWMYGTGFPKSLNGPWGGTALKPAHEPIVLARKPLIGTVAANVPGARHRGAERGWVPDWARPGRPEERGRALRPRRLQGAAGRRGVRQSGTMRNEHRQSRPLARERVPRRRGRRAPGRAEWGRCTQRGNAPSSLEGSRLERHVRWHGPTLDTFGASGDSGGASRFFYTAKASRKERGAGNTHPTVKPLALMRWLCRLVTPPGGLVLDPFTGSGTTALACKREGFRFIGIEREAAYVDIALDRLAG